MLLTLILSTLSFAASDSVAVFLRPEKAVVLVNEFDTKGPLHGWLRGKDLFWETDYLMVNCGRAPKGVTCTIRFLPADGRQFGPKAVAWEGDAPLGDVNARFESSRGDVLELKAKSGRLRVRASKR